MQLTNEYSFELSKAESDYDLFNYDIIFVNGVIGVGKTHFINTITSGNEKYIVQCPEPNHKWDYLLANNCITGKESFISTLIEYDIKQKATNIFAYNRNRSVLLKPIFLIERDFINHFTLFREYTTDQLILHLTKCNDLINFISQKLQCKICQIIIDDYIENCLEKIEHRGRVYEQSIDSHQISVMTKKMLLGVWYFNQFYSSDIFIVQNGKVMVLDIQLLKNNNYITNISIDDFIELLKNII